MINKVILVGNVGIDPEVRTTESGVKVARVRLATSERYVDKQSGERKELTEWHTITLWRGLADVVDRYVHKGSQIYVEGRLRTREWVDKDQVKDYVLDLMDKCGLRDYYYERYPHEFSGGQRQRICIARALSVNPKLVICDEPVSALDVSIQAQIINLLKDLQKSLNLAYVFISHDLSVVKFISDKICVMYLGAVMEFGSKEDIFSNPLHPYTKALFSAIPNPNPDVKMNRIVLKGDIPSPANPPKGCRFHTRCPYATEKCKYVTPTYKEYGNGHFAACHLLEENEEK